MSLWERAGSGERIPCGSREISVELVDQLVKLGQFVHPIFTDEAYARSSGFEATPLPGQAVTLVMGGLIEQNPLFGTEVIALIGFDEVRFLSAVVGGSTVEVDAEVLEAIEGKRPDRGTLLVRLRATTAAGEACTSVARFLVRRDAA